MCECNRICIPSVTATVISASVASSVATLRLNQTLTALSWFKLKVPCAIISSLSDTATVSFTDGINTYTAQGCNGNNLQINTLKRAFCGCSRCGCAKESLLAVAGNNPEHVTVRTCCL